MQMNFQSPPFSCNRCYFCSEFLPDALVDHVVAKDAIIIRFGRRLLLLLPRPPAAGTLAALEALGLVGVDPALPVVRELNLAAAADAAALGVVRLALDDAAGDELLLVLHGGVAAAGVLEEGHAEEQLEDEEDEKGDEEDDDHGEGGDEVVRRPGEPGPGVERRAVGGAAERVADQRVEAVQRGHHGGRRGPRRLLGERRLRRLLWQRHGEVGGEEHVVGLDGGADEEARQRDDGEAETAGEGGAGKGLFGGSDECLVSRGRDLGRPGLHECSSPCIGCLMCVSKSVA